MKGVMNGSGLCSSIHYSRQRLQCCYTLFASAPLVGWCEGTAHLYLISRTTQVVKANKRKGYWVDCKCRSFSWKCGEWNGRKMTKNKTFSQCSEAKDRYFDCELRTYMSVPVNPKHIVCLPWARDIWNKFPTKKFIYSPWFICSALPTLEDSVGVQNLHIQVMHRTIRKAELDFSRKFKVPGYREEQDSSS